MSESEMATVVMRADSGTFDVIEGSGSVCKFMDDVGVKSVWCTEA